MANDYLDFLAHHGILGQKWGVRRYQNPDGSLTSAGKKRYTGFDGKTKYSAKEIYAARKKRDALYPEWGDADAKQHEAWESGKLDEMKKYQKIRDNIDRELDDIEPIADLTTRGDKARKVAIGTAVVTGTLAVTEAMAFGIAQLYKLFGK